MLRNIWLLHLFTSNENYCQAGQSGFKIEPKHTGSEARQVIESFDVAQSQEVIHSKDLSIQKENQQEKVLVKSTPPEVAKFFADAAPSVHLYREETKMK